MVQGLHWEMRVSLYELVRAFSVFKGRSLLSLAGIEQGRAKSLQKAGYGTLRCLYSMLSDAGSRWLGFGRELFQGRDFPVMFKTDCQPVSRISGRWEQRLITLQESGWATFPGETVIGRTGSSIPASIVREVLGIVRREGWISAGTGCKGIQHMHFVRSSCH